MVVALTNILVREFNKNYQDLLQTLCRCGNELCKAIFFQIDSSVLLVSRRGKMKGFLASFNHYSTVYITWDYNVVLVKGILSA